MRRFLAGETAVQRDVFRGKVWSAHAMHVVEDSAEAFVLECRPGAEVLASVRWIDWLLTGDRARREQALPDLAAGTWELGRWAWRGTAVREWAPPDTWFSVYAFYDVADGDRLDRWYVNFQQPMRRTALGFDTFDLLVDLVVAPDLSRWEWKDEDEYAQGRRLGVVSDADHRAVERAREEAVALIEARGGPFAASPPWRAAAPAPDRPTPTLPGGVMNEPYGWGR